MALYPHPKTSSLHTNNFSFYKTRYSSQTSVGLSETIRKAPLADADTQTALGKQKNTFCGTLVISPITEIL